MNKLQTTIKQKIEGFIASLSAKVPNVAQIRLRELSTIEAPKKETTISLLRSTVTSIFPPEKIIKYRQLEQKLKQHKQTLQIIDRGKTIFQLVDEYSSMHERQLQRGYPIILQILESLNDFQQLSLIGYPDFSLLRQQLYLQLLGRVQRAEDDLAGMIQSLKDDLKKIDLPLKKGQVRKEKPSVDQITSILTRMHRQSCVITLKRQISSLLQKEIKCQERIMELFWEQSLKTVLYLFVSGSELHNLEQPGWLFEYLQLLLNSNYKFFCDFILGEGLSPEVSKALNNYFLEGSIECLLMRAIQTRLSEDLTLLNPFLCFNFLDEISGFEIKLHNVFGIRAGLVQKILVRYEKILDSALEYENQRFDTKIFDDFININYSKVNLKNLEAYNLMTAFLNMLEKLKAKYIPINETHLKKKIAKFYRDRIMVLVAHLKTSFDRIYHHSRLPKLDILVSFKRTENELRNSLSEITLADPQLDESLQREYYCFLEQYYEAAALQALTPIHKKIHISFADLLDKFKCTDENAHDVMLRAFQKIQQQWMTKMDQIGKFSSYVDTKLRAMFFTYLEALEFSSVGLNLYLKIFEQFLQAIFGEDRHRTLISLISAEKERYLEYVQAHPSSLAFLSQEECMKISKFNERKPQDA